MSDGTEQRPALRVANCSGFFGDRPSAAREQVEGGRIDVLTGDWLAELTMLILAKIRAKRPGGGFAGTFVRQVEDVLGTCLDQGTKIVSNAGGLDPAGCAEAVQEAADRLGLSPKIAFVTGDDLLDRVVELVEVGSLRAFPGAEGIGDPERYLTANAYLGCWGIVEALAAGADIVITGRVTDAALACGPAAWRHGWTPADLDPLAGAVVAGHLIECSAQVTGGNYAFYAEEIAARSPRPVRFGFPWVDIEADGSFVLGKHDGTGGLVSAGTVTSQLLYEIGGPRYFGPDVTTRFDSVRIEDLGDDRVRVSGTRGEHPPETLKVAMNELGGFRNSFTVALTGLDIEAKAELAEATFWDACPTPPDGFDRVVSSLVRTDRPDPETQEVGTATWTVQAFSREEKVVGRSFSDAVVQTALSGIAGMYLAGDGPAGASAYGIYRPGLVPAGVVDQRVRLVWEGRVVPVRTAAPQAGPKEQLPADADEQVTSYDGPTTLLPLGAIVGARSGDKGGDANLGVFVRDPAHYEWLSGFLTVDRLRELLPEVADRPVQRYSFPGISALNFVIEGFLDDGVASCARPDRQAKALGEWLRARMVAIPAAFLTSPQEVAS